MRTPGTIDSFHVASLSIASHTLENLAEFPDSRAFYAANKIGLPAAISGLLYMATCNRIELYVEFAPNTARDEGFTQLQNLNPVFQKMFQKEPCVFSGGAVLEHLISVASGLKSLALGETQIAGQIKRDMANAQSRGWLSTGMMALMQKALETQKKIRSSTGISENSYSLMSLVEDAIRERGLRPITHTVILVGASEMSAKVARFALRRGVRNFILVRKNPALPMNADMQNLMETHPAAFTSITLEELKSGVKSPPADAMVLASTAPHALLTAEDIRHLTQQGILADDCAIVDLSLPANVMSDTALTLSNRLISLSSLQQLSELARAERSASAREAEPIIRRAVYQLWLDLLYRENPEVVRSYIEGKETQSESEWQRLANEAALSEKQKRIMYDFMKKEQRRALQQHREMILDLISGGTVLPSLQRGPAK